MALVLAFGENSFADDAPDPMQRGPGKVKCNDQLNLHFCYLIIMSDSPETVVNNGLLNSLQYNIKTFKINSIYKPGIF